MHKWINTLRWKKKRKNCFWARFSVLIDFEVRFDYPTMFVFDYTTFLSKFLITIKKTLNHDKNFINLKESLNINTKIWGYVRSGALTEISYGGVRLLRGGPDFLLIHSLFMVKVRIFFHTNFNLEEASDPLAPLPWVRLSVLFPINTSQL